LRTLERKRCRRRAWGTADLGNNMNISIFGLGYVGAVITACFARDGHRVLGVDTDPQKVNLVNQGQSPIVEKDLEELLAAGVKGGAITATQDHGAALRDTEVSMICVGTPSKPTGDLDLTFVLRVCHDIGAVLKDKPGRHLVVVRSTMLPGSMDNVVIPALEQASGKRAGRDFGVAYNPEFLREGSAIADFYQPPKTVIGAPELADADRVAALYEKASAPLIKTSLKTAEMVKYTDNVFHALKVVYANEIGSLCQAAGVDAREVMEIFCQDRKLNLSPAYLKPGFAFGGSCLPKDLRALTRLAHQRDVEVPLLQAIGASNDLLVRRAVERVLAKGRRRVGVLGFAFKGGTDDLRESPVVALVEALLGKGCDLKLYDRHVSLARLMGANRRYLDQHIPHVARLMVESLEELLAHAEVIIIGNSDRDFTAALNQLSPEQLVLDLTPSQGPVTTPAAYERLTG
jgi:GDP-mannose 6-dehydrogenase